MNTLQKSTLLAATLIGIGGVWTAFSAADPAPSSLNTRVEAGGSAQSEAIAPMSSLRSDWSTVPVEPAPATF
jgi:hypothetical protein